MVGDLSSYFRSVLQLKTVKRAGWVSKVKIDNAESVADHTFSMCAIAMLLSDILGLDTCKVMKMVILHDLAESIVGDYIPGDVPANLKITKEKRAMSFILSGLPRKERIEYAKTWFEYVHNRTDAARFVHRVDKLEMALQADKYAKQGHAGRLLAPFLESASKAIGNGDIVSQILNSLKSGTTKR